MSGVSHLFPGGAGPHFTNLSHLRGSRSALGKSPNTSRSSLRPRRRHNDSQDLKSFKKGAAGANATIESESEESGYGETCGETTMQALSFDEPSLWLGSEHTPLKYIESDDESTCSYISGVFLPTDPRYQRDRSTQTPGYARTQTTEQVETSNTITTQTEEPPRSVAIQTLNTSLHSIGAQTKKHSRSRVNLLRSLLHEVKDIKRQQGLDDSEEDNFSIASDMSVNRDVLEALSRDVAALKAAQGTMSQTAAEQSTQTSQRQGRVNDMLEDLRRMKAGNQTPSIAQSTTRSLNRTTPVRFDSPRSMTNHLIAAHNPAAMANGHHDPSIQDFNATYPPVPGGRRRITQDELDNINERLDRLSSYQIPQRHVNFVPAYPSQMLPPTFVQQPPTVSQPPVFPRRRYRVREFSRSYDDLDMLSDDEYRGRRRRGYGGSREGVMGRYHLDDALLEATIASKQLKRMSAKMKRNLREELNRSRY